MDCPGLIEKFERDYAQRQKTTEKPPRTRERKKDPAHADDSEVELNRGFSRGYEPETILGATDAKGKIMFLMQWKNSSQLDLVYAKTANIKCPQVVIAFYQQSLRWSPANNCDRHQS